MPSKKRGKPLYQRGEYRLYPSPGRNHEILWYDSTRKRERSISAGTTEIGPAIIATDNAYIKAHGGVLTCPTCGQEISQRGEPVIVLVRNYLDSKPAKDAVAHRLAHVITYLVDADMVEATANQIDEAWVARFRDWMKGRADRSRAPGTIENSVIALAAAFRFGGVAPGFKPISTKEVNRTPLFRASVQQLAAMFAYCLYPDSPTPKMRERHIRERENLLRYLRAAVATWARPDAIMDISTDPKRRQWISGARVLNLNPDGRRQTRKYRPSIPIAHQFAPHLDATQGYYITVGSIKSAWEAMANHLDLPKEGESGTKLIRRSVSHLARKIIGEEHWVQGKMMLGHGKASTSDIYALPDPANLGRALAATESIIDQIESECRGAFYRTFTATNAKVVSICGAKNG